MVEGGIGMEDEGLIERECEVCVGGGECQECSGTGECIDCNGKGYIEEFQMTIKGDK